MKAVAVVPGTHDSLHLRDDVPDPATAGRDVRVRVLETGVCATDIDIAEGLYGSAPAGSPYLVLGHENLGVVESAPSGAGFAVGDLVVSTVRRGCPDDCRACLSDRPDACLSGHYLERGIQRLHGFMSERYADAPRYLVRVPAPLRRVGVLLEPMSIVQKGIEQALHVQDRLAWHPRRALVVGAGPIGLLAALTLRLAGLEVALATLEPEGSPKQALVDELGIRYVSTSATPIESLPSTLGVIDVLFEATGATSAVWPALGVLGLNGVAVLTSVTPGQEKLDVDVAAWNRQMVLGNRVILGTVNAAHRHFEAGVRHLEAAEARFPGWTERLVTRRLPFVDAPRALERRPSDIKTVLEFA